MRYIKIGLVSFLVSAATVATAQQRTATLTNPFTDTVNYSCQSGRELSVDYSFNAHGLPEKAVAVLDGRKRTMPINLSTSDNVATTFGQDNQYKISAGYIDASNYRQSSVMAFSPSSEILYKNCFANNNDRHSNNKVKRSNKADYASEQTVSYSCQNNRKIRVTYLFNKQGLPTEAQAVIDGWRTNMPINLGRSDSENAYFGDEGEYRLSSGHLTNKSVKESSILITSPQDEILYKNCFVR